MKGIVQIILYGVCIPVLIVFYAIKQLVDLCTLPWLLYYAYKIIHTLARNMRTWKSVREVSEESGVPLSATRRFMLAIASKHLLFRPRIHEVLQTLSEKECADLYRTAPTVNTYQYYEFRLKVPTFGTARIAPEEAQLLPA